MWRRGSNVGGLVCCFFVILTPLRAQEQGFTFSRDAQEKLGLTTVTLGAAERETQVAGFAKVLDPGPLAQLCSDLFAAEAAAAASRAEAQRATALHAANANMSAKDTESAIAQARGDEARRLLLRQRLGLEWGTGISRLSDVRLKALVVALSKGTAALVHVDTPSNEGQKGARSVSVDIGDQSLKGIVLGPARTAEPRLSSSGLLVEVQGASSVLLSVGLTQSAHIDTGNPVKGVVLPREALVRYRGETWAYVREGDVRFRRVLLQNGVPQDAGLFVPEGLSPGQQVIAHGSLMLFAAEQNQAANPQ